MKMCGKSVDVRREVRAARHTVKNMYVMKNSEEV